MLFDNIRGKTMFLPFLKKNGEHTKDQFPKSEFITLASYHNIDEKDAEDIYKTFGKDPSLPKIISKISRNGGSLEAYAQNYLRSA
jgi:hypothetical protein